MGDDKAFYYREVSSQDIQADKVQEAQRVLAFCKKKLRIPELEIIWCRKIEKSTYELDELFIKLEENLSQIAAHTFKVKDRTKIRIIYQKSDDHFSGLSKFKWVGKDENKLWISENVSFDQVGLTVAHECQHIHDFNPRGPYRIPRTKREWDMAEERAEGFARKVMREIRE